MAKKKARKCPVSPCLRCKHRDGHGCLAMRCQRWQRYFCRAWDYARELVRPYIEKEGS